MKVSALAIAALAGVSAGPALAQMAETPFTGPRAEVFGGYVHSKPTTRTVNVGSTLVSTSAARSHNGGVGGGLLGYDMAFGDSLVVGAFGSYSLLTSVGCGSLSGRNFGCLQPSRQIEGGGRVGFRYSDKVLIYGKGAYVNTSVDTTVLDNRIYRTSHRNRDGWRAGAGAEYNLNDHFYVKAEYDYTRAKSFDATPYGFPNSNIRYEFHQATAGIGVRF